MIKLIPLGTKFGRWTVGTQAESRKSNSGKFMTFWNVNCECGVSKEVAGYALRNGTSQSCGCLPSHFKTHGLANSKGYKTWNGMIQRTTNPENPNWMNYGGRGITVCEDWKVIENFLKDMGEPPRGLQLDRIDNEKGYNKENCRWVTCKQNSRNKRTNALVEYDGRLVTLAEASELSKINAYTIRSRMKLGVTGADLFRPPNSRSKS